MNKAKKEGIILYNSELCLSQKYILENTDISSGYICNASSRFSNGSSKSWRHIKVNRVKYFVYDSLPRSSQAKLLPKGELLAKTHGLDLNNDFIILVFDKAKLYSYKLFMENNTFQRAFALAIIHETSMYVRENDISFSKGAFFRMLANEIELREIKHLPKTWRNLRDKIKEYSDLMNMQI